MNTVLGMKISKVVEGLVSERVSLANAPYEFKITGVTGNGYDHITTAHIAYKKLKNGLKEKAQK